MSEYAKISVDVKGYYSGSTYYEEVFLSKEMWEKIEKFTSKYISFYELDGKHSEVLSKIEVEYMTKEQLETYYPIKDNDGSSLFEYIENELYYADEQLSNTYLKDVQKEVSELQQYEYVKVKTRKGLHKSETLKSYLENPENYVIASKDYYEELEEDSNLLSCLECHGVDNWQGYDDACRMHYDGDE